MHTFFIYLCLLLYNLPVIHGTVFQASGCYILNIVLFIIDCVLIWPHELKVSHLRRKLK